MIQIRLAVIVTNDLANAVQPAAISALLPDLNSFFLAGNIKFAFDRALDYEVVPDSLLDRDFRLVDPALLGNPRDFEPAIDNTE